MPDSPASATKSDAPAGRRSHPERAAIISSVTHATMPVDASAGRAGSCPRSSAPRTGAHTLLVVSFDEGTTAVHGGGQAFTMVARKGLAGFTSSTLRDHDGLLRTIEGIFGLPCRGAARTAPPRAESLP